MKSDRDTETLNKDFLMLSRRLLSNELWNERRVFSKAEAWIDILFTVRYAVKPKIENFGYKTLICHRGEALKSIETWAWRWGWSKSKVVRFFGMLKNRNMIVTTNETITTRLTVCNYNTYNKLRNGNGTEVEQNPERKRNGNGTDSETEEEGGRKGKKGKKVKAGAKAPMPPSIKVFQENTHRYPNKSLWEDISSAVGAKEEDLIFWGKVVKGWVGVGWNPINVVGMLELYKKREIPGIKKQPQQGYCRT